MKNPKPAVPCTAKLSPAPRVTMAVFGGVIINRQFARRPRVLRLEPSKPRGGTKEVRP